MSKDPWDKETRLITLAKVSEYKKNYPGYKIGFLIFDEAPAYIETFRHKDIEAHVGDVLVGKRYYLPQFDKRFVNLFIGSEIDFIVWMTPFKKMPQNTWIGLKEIYLLDLHKVENGKTHFKNYKYENIKCLELYQ